LNTSETNKYDFKDDSITKLKMTVVNYLSDVFYSSLLASTSCTLAEVNRTFSRYTIHENFNQTTYDNDIALLELDRPVDYGVGIRPICLHHENYNDLIFLEKKSIMLSYGNVVGCGKRGGWPGMPTQLQVRLTVSMR